MPLPGTREYEEIRNNNESFDFKEINGIASVKSFCELSTAELEKYQKIFFRKFYFRPKIIIGLIKEIKSFRQFLYLLERVIKLFFHR